MAADIQQAFPVAWSILGFQMVTTDLLSYPIAVEKCKEEAA
jgi:hypothetical protein